MAIHLKYRLLASIDMNYNFGFGPEKTSAISLSPTSTCEDLLRKYRLRWQPTVSGGQIVHEVCGSQPNTPRWPISNHETFTFLARVVDSNLWTYVDAGNWKESTAFHIASGLRTGIIHQGRLPLPVLFRPLTFRVPVLLDANKTVLRVTDSSNSIALSREVRSRQPNEAPGTLSDEVINLSSRLEGMYQVTVGNQVNTTPVYCSSSFGRDVFMIVELSISSTAPLPLRYEILLPAQSITWQYRILWKNASPVPQDLRIAHQPVAGESVIQFNKRSIAIGGHQLLEFTSAAPVGWRLSPRQLRLESPPNKRWIEHLPAPLPGHVILDDQLQRIATLNLEV